MRTSTFLSSLLGYIKKLFRNAIFQILSLIVALGSIGITYAAWTTLTAGQGASGQPVNQTLVQGIINNLNDLQTRLTAVNPSGTTLSASTVQINSVVTGGTACSPDGLIGRNSSGAILSCQSSVWSAPTAQVDQGTVCGIYTETWTPGGWVTQSTTCKGISPVTACPAGYTKYWNGNGTTYHQWWCVKN